MPNGPDWWQVAIYSGVLWTLLGAPMRPVGIALAGAWFAGEVYTLTTWDSLPVNLYLITDPIVLAIYWKWGTTKLDTAIMAVFPVMGATYFLDYQGYITAYTAWWTLFYLALLQFALAGPWKAAERIGSDLVRLSTKGVRDAVGFAKHRAR